MFTRMVEVTTKSGKAVELSRVLIQKTLPILRDQAGFVDEIVLISSDSPDRLLALSFWQTQEDAEKYNREVFSRVKEIIASLITDTPKVQTFNVTASTVHEIATQKAA